ncbi:CLUMA_CG000975, isoform A [Clunio marinus]|uniref:CLUMA_CG000975, isoform A n=1 Tax=Clunio marinus TaxID=568069 RepID=A0A1J1HGN0_9DIPT|nr:CLUMA_CG000975, isoform A [Clunio marinus]
MQPHHTNVTWDYVNLTLLLVSCNLFEVQFMSQVNMEQLKNIYNTRGYSKYTTNIDIQNCVYRNIYAAKLTEIGYLIG